MPNRFSCRFAVSIALTLAVAAGVQSRETGAPYGERIAVSGSDWPEARPQPALVVFPDLADSSPTLARDAAARKQAAQWETRVRELEALGGPYADGLEEPLADLARQRVSEGRYAEALSLYQRSLHVLRINSGLSSPAQMAVVRAMLQLQRVLGGAEALDNLYGYYYRLGWLEADAQDDGPRWRVALEFLRWQRERLRRDLVSDADRALLELHGLNEQLLEQASAEEADAEIRVELVRSQLLNLYLIRDRVTPKTPDALSVLAPPRSRRPDMLPEDIYRDRLLNIQRSAQRAGSALLASLIRHLESPVERAGIYRALGDWEQWNGSLHRAEEAWRRAFDLLNDAGEESRIAQWFGAPVELPDNGVFWQPEDATERSLVRVTFDVNARGRARRAEASVLSGRDSASIIAVRELRGVRFRPRFDDGRARGTDSVEREYRVYR